jgi:phosphopantetheine--protein transferase-like protein
MRGIGIDVVDIARFSRLVAVHGSSFTRRWFVEREHQQALLVVDRGAAFAELFAVMVAVWKALGIAERGDAVPWRAISAISGPSGWQIELTGPVAQRAIGIAGIGCVSRIVGGVAVAIAQAAEVPESGQVEMHAFLDGSDQDGRFVQVGGASSLLLDVTEHALDLVCAQIGGLRDGVGADAVIHGEQA